jgi:hypothetical protein
MWDQMLRSSYVGIDVSEDPAVSLFRTEMSAALEDVRCRFINSRICTGARSEPKGDDRPTKSQLFRENG